jgi:hypothetical protein
LLRNNALKQKKCQTRLVGRHGILNFGCCATMPYSILDTRLREYKLWIADPHFHEDKFWIGKGEIFCYDGRRIFKMVNGFGCEARGGYVGR